MSLFRKRTPVKEPTKIDTIIIVGNGFDRWQGLNTSYTDFQKYYTDHIDDILKKFRIKKYKCQRSDGALLEFTDVELIFGDPFDPGKLDSEFWNHFESALADIDAERINLFFGKEKSDLRDMNRSLKNAKKILTEAFCGWIASIGIEEKESGFAFGDNCVFINFNYTDTLIKRFHVDEWNEFHIHGEATDKRSIIFGHNSHPQEPEPILSRFGGRFEGLYYIDKILYETDKHCQDNIQVLCAFLALHGIMSEDITDIYVLGQSMNPVDIEYFDFLVRSSKVQKPEEEDPASTPEEDMDDWADRMQYVIDAVGYHNEPSEASTAAMLRKLQEEQDARNQAFQKTFFRTIGKGRNKRQAAKIQPRLEDAKWHISYYGDQDKEWKQIVMQELGCSRYQLYPTIDACIAKWKK